MANFSSTPIYIAIRNQDERSRMEDQLVLDGVNVSTFKNAEDLWNAFQISQARFIITDRKFGTDFDGIELTRQIRKNFGLPYVYILMRGAMGQIKDIQEGLSAGVDDYLIKPHNLFQIRSRVLVGMRWLTHMDSVATNSAGTATPPKAI